MMDNYPRTLSSFFMDGSPAGRVLYTLSNWSGAGLRIPRDLVRLTSQTRTELYRTGVYLLFGKDSKNPNQARARAGQGGILKQRLFDHLATIDWWDECVVFFANDGSLNTGHTRYLELMLIREAKKAGKYLVTQNEPSEDTFDLTEQDRAQVDEFFSYVKLIMSSVGHPVLQQEKTPQTEEESVFVIRSKLDDGTAFEAMGRKSIGAQLRFWRVPSQTRR
ncbi:GIY-YIG nuclease family protein [Alicyclobacillus sp. SO9]|uniref:GIY-YIG nuclease family protein n=1 Tax=Alicyclobacillus sp. SO9 TaxID=2665646 RepID=UPI0018E8705E|nr:GIY-YIG nuclease family protein [Alicyclobacillus sp. SO9]QQE80611.1 GIY-YIG nuclease family protein [Alicyclobacillus sp. SO9]